MNTISHQVAGFLEREGLLERDEENIYLNLEGDEDPMEQVLGCSVSYRIAKKQKGSVTFNHFTQYNHHTLAIRTWTFKCPETPASI
ncbi:MAG: hypothetical protein ABW170_07900 [Candidatus Thiodiazotropha sp. L084R]